LGNTWKTFTTKKKCCLTKRICHGDNCREHKYSCKWRGKILYLNFIENCKWKKTGKNSTRRYCCRSKKSCLGKICKTKVLNCKWTNQIITKKNKKKCEMRNYQHGKRLRCCKWISSCAPQKLGSTTCIHHSGKCFWKGPIVFTKIEIKCHWIKKKNSSRRKCCKHISKCLGEKCRRKKNVCKLMGNKIKNKKVTRCYWKLIENGKSQYCCNLTKRCYKDQCHFTKTKCKLTGLTITHKFNFCKNYWSFPKTFTRMMYTSS